MTNPTPIVARRSSRLTLAHLACLCLALGLLAWSVMPALVERILTRCPPRLETLALGAASFPLGLLFLALWRPVRRGLRWALWTALVSSLALAVVGVVITLLNRVHELSMFQLLMAGACAGASALALAEKRDDAMRFRHY